MYLPNLIHADDELLAMVDSYFFRYRQLVDEGLQSR
jgi:hypothetical protein